MPVRTYNLRESGGGRRNNRKKRSRWIKILTRLTIDGYKGDVSLRLPRNGIGNSTLKTSKIVGQNA